MKRFSRSDRLSEELRKELSHIISYELKEPGIAQMVSVMRVEVTGDLRHATVLISVYGTEKEKTDTISAINKAAGFIRKTIGKRMHIRRTPEFYFKIDDSIEYGSKIQKILIDIKKEEEK